MRRLKLAFLFFFYLTASFAQDSLVWKFQTGSSIYSSPAISGSSVFFGSGDMNLYSVDKESGKVNWKYETKGQVHSSPCIYENKVLFSSSDGYIYSVDKNRGSLIWKYKTKGEHRYDMWDYYISSPVVSDNVVYIGSGDSTVYALRAESGKVVWTYKTGGIVHASPVVKDNIVYIGSFDGYFYALNSKSGKLMWKFKTVGDENFPKGEIQKAAVIYKNSVIFGSRDYNIYALDLKTGTGKWNMKEKGSWIIATPFIYKDNIYFGTSDSHRFYCMNAGSGEVKWALPLNMRVYGSATLLDGKIVFGCFNGRLYFVDPDTGKVQFTFQTKESKERYSTVYMNDDHFRKDFVLYGKDDIDSEKKILSLGSILSSPLVETGTVYFGDSNGYFYALRLKGNK